MQRMVQFNRGLSPEFRNQVTTLFSDRRIPATLRHMNGHLMRELDATSYRIHPFRLTKVWSHKDYPLLDVGVFELNRYRIGITYAALSVKRPHCAVNTCHRDGQTRVDGNGGGSVHCEPESAGRPMQDAGLREPPPHLKVDAGRRAPRDEAGGCDDLNRADTDCGARAAAQPGVTLDDVAARAA